MPRLKTVFRHDKSDGVVRRGTQDAAYIQVHRMKLMYVLALMNDSMGNVRLKRVLDGGDSTKVSNVPCVESSFHRFGVDSKLGSVRRRIVKNVQKRFWTHT